MEYMGVGAVVEGVRLRVVECHGEAGDAILCHPLIYHASAANCADRPRFMRSGHVAADAPRCSTTRTLPSARCRG
jgi:hypothetical protein